MFKEAVFKKSDFIQEVQAHLKWAFIAYVCGICLYFLDFFNAYFMASLTFIFALSWFYSRKKLVLSWISIFFFFLGIGFLNIAGHVHINHHPVLESPLFQAPIHATVSENNLLSDKQILTLSDIQWQNPSLKMPRKIRVNFMETVSVLEKGDKIKAIVSVYPISNTATLGNSFSTQLWFNRIGAIGKAQHIQIIHEQENSFSFFNLRQKIITHLFKILPRSQAEVASALITGQQKLIDPNTYQIYRRAGIIHVLSVSGFHMALLAGFLFFLIQSLCALWPRLALNWNSKKIAAFASLIITFFYLGLSGFQIPALRAFIMIAFVFAGILCNRNVLSMRSLILAGFLLLLIQPQMLLSVSFQLSFTAVMVLAGFCHWIQNQPFGKIKKIIITFLGLNFIVFISLTPFIIFHFNQFMSYGLLGNMLFSFMFSFFIMPLLFMGCLMMPLHMDSIFFYLAGLGLDLIQTGATLLANLPHSEIVVAGFSGVFLVLIMLGLFMIFLMKKPFKIIGLFMIFLVSILIYFEKIPDAIVTHKTLAFKKENILWVRQGSDMWLAENWRQKLGCEKINLFDFSDKIMLKEVKIALNPSQCSGAKLAILTYLSPNDCFSPVLVAKENETYALFIQDKKVKIKRLSPPFFFEKP